MKWGNRLPKTSGRFQQKQEVFRPAEQAWVQRSNPLSLRVQVLPGHRFGMKR